MSQIDFVIKLAKETIKVTLPATATIAELKRKLEADTKIPVANQRLMFQHPVDKAHRRDAPETLEVGQLLAGANLKLSGNRHPIIPAMLIGTRAEDNTRMAKLDSKTTSEVSRLVATTVEHAGRWYRCSYNKGYLLQTAYVCRTCIDNGSADPDHVICLACADYCHGNHEVEEWGLHYHMRCDCCTSKCWKKPAQAASTAASGTTPGPNVVTSESVHKRSQRSRKRSRSSSPLTPSRSGTHFTTIPATPDLPTTTATEVDDKKQRTESASVTTPPAPSTGTSTSQPTAAATANTSATAVTARTPTQQVGEEDFPRPPEVHKCAFLVDSDTGKPPLYAVLPPNRKNRYPRDLFHWCYCKRDEIKEDPESGGIVCLLCATCYWSTHMTRLYTRQLRTVPCYGEVIAGETVAFKCKTCNTLVCPPCRFRCHKEHEIEPGMVFPNKEEGTTNGAPEGMEFQCGCGTTCFVSEEVPADFVDEWPDTIPSDVAQEMMNSDIFTGFICAQCMQEYPWLATDLPTTCHHGQLPPKVTDGLKPVVACGCAPTATVNEAEVYPYHGMLCPVNTFREELTCKCEACRAAFSEFAPRATEEATEMVMQLHDECDHCGRNIKEDAGFVCQTCEISAEKSFLLCKDCNELRLRLIDEARRQSQGPPVPLPGAAPANPPGAPTAAPAAPTPAPVPTTTAPAPAPTTVVAHPTYNHDLSHVFIEDTVENLSNMFGFQMMQTLDPESRNYVMQNWEEVRDNVNVVSNLSDVFGQVPLQFDEDELREIAETNMEGRFSNKAPEKKEEEEKTKNKSEAKPKE